MWFHKGTSEPWPRYALCWGFKLLKMLLYFTYWSWHKHVDTKCIIKTWTEFLGRQGCVFLNYYCYLAGLCKNYWVDYDGTWMWYWSGKKPLNSAVDLDKASTPAIVVSHRINSIYGGSGGHMHEHRANSAANSAAHNVAHNVATKQNTKFYVKLCIKCGPIAFSLK